MIATDTPTKTSSSKITEALELLNEAAKEKKEELKGLMTDKYSHIRQALVAGGDQGKLILDKAKFLARDAFTMSEEKIKELETEAVKRVHQDPWPYIAGAAVCSLLLGFLMGSKNKKS